MVSSVVNNEQEARVPKLMHRRDYIFPECVPLFGSTCPGGAELSVPLFGNIHWLPGQLAGCLISMAMTAALLPGLHGCCLLLMALKDGACIGDAQLRRGEGGSYACTGVGLNPIVAACLRRALHRTLL